MLDWDNEHNEIGKGYVTLYIPDYNEEDGMIDSFNLEKLDYIVKKLYRNFHHFEHPENKEVLIGLNSDSFTGDTSDKHNLFMEWDRKYGLPNLDKLRKAEGVISQTDNGFHFIKEDWLTLEELVKIQKEWKCCKGFIKHTEEMDYACLRVSPKKDNVINIIDYRDGLLYNVYKTMVLGLGG